MKTEASVPVPVYHHYTPSSIWGIIRFLGLYQIDDRALPILFGLYSDKIPKALREGAGRRVGEDECAELVF